MQTRCFRWQAIQVQFLFGNNWIAQRARTASSGLVDWKASNKKDAFYFTGLSI
ncbi:hypothetical protein CFter6_0136 [Collimonas fungivorans]|uniref:Uncharacterized protein n=1 Tax=Collimonas fungivorans TaxID=158899 RepID=A0A127P554_9BURK|nr:hypothetical protein CFter6_0136 [Collimonas fungivorans]